MEITGVIIDELHDIILAAPLGGTRRTIRGVTITDHRFGAPRVVETYSGESRRDRRARERRELKARRKAAR